MLLEPAVESPAAARAYCDEILGSTVRTAIREDARLVVSELVTNAVIHARTTIELSILVDGSALRIEVTDYGSDRPQVWARDESGRGIPIIEALAHDWGVVEFGSAKTVWCEIAV
ncbi:MAG TPA: ATP-binding protein [Acidimicrobiia bacterium]|jgi:anti-sigma regulatory factor (Ser/Thr protein kinase)